MIEGFGFLLREVKSTDLEQLRVWRNRDDIRLNMLDQRVISSQMQQAWYNKIQEAKDQLNLVISYQGNAIGAANLKTTADNLNNEDLEPGFYIGDESLRGSMLAFAPAILLNDLAFERFNARGLYAQVLITNKAALKFNKLLGYMVENEDNSWVSMKLTKDAHERASAGMRKILQRWDK